MKFRLFLFFIVAVLAAPRSLAQTLFVPNGFSASGIGTSTTANIGIGTNAPGGILHLKATTPWLKIEKGATSNEGGLAFIHPTATLFYLYTDNNSNSFQINSGLETDAAPRLQFPYNNNDIYLAQSGGNIGIGTSSPLSKLHIFAGNTNGGMGGLSIYGTNGTSPKIYLAGDASNVYAATLAYNSSTSNLDITPRSGYATIFTSGNVGIGTAVPTGTLHVKATTPWLKIEKDASANEGGLSFSHATATLFNFYTDNYTNALQIQSGVETDAAPRLQLPYENHNINLALSGGNVGIGTTTPQKKLQIFAGNTNGASDGLSIYGTNGTSPKLYLAGDESNVYAATLAYNSSTSNLDITPRSGYATIFTSGNVGIGTPVPTGTLHVKATTPWLKIEKDASANEGGVVFSHATATLFNFYTDNYTNALQIQSGVETDAAPRLQLPYGNNNINMVLSGGNVGIGCTSPDSKLTVKGTVHAEEVKVEILNSICPDYVFEPNYDLPTLAETETYIKENKHLPEVPSAKQMEEEGLNLKEMNLLLLKKVEELTLYLIDLNARDEQRQAQIKKLQEEISSLKAIETK
jgi:hypothetical protein